MSYGTSHIAMKFDKSTILKKRRCLIALISCLLIWVLSGCVAKDVNNTMPVSRAGESKQETALKDYPDSDSAVTQTDKQKSSSSYIPPRVTWRPEFTIGDVRIEESETGLPKLRIGANLSARNGTVVLRDVIKKLAELKGFNVSWAHDVEQEALVDVDIQASDDFWIAVDNILRQLDYFFEFHDKTIVITYRETKRFTISTPYVKRSYGMTVGGNMAGTTAGKKDTMTSLTASNFVTTPEQGIDVWKEIENSIEKILLDYKPKAKKREMQKKETAESASTKYYGNKLDVVQRGSATERKKEYTHKEEETDSSQFYYSLDRSVGMVTVTASQSILKRISSYIEALNKRLKRQITIEAKIIEVDLDKSHSMGIDWSGLLKNSPFDATTIFGSDPTPVVTGYGVDEWGNIEPSEVSTFSELYPTGKFLHRFSLSPKSFTIILDALNEYGETRLLSNPKVVVTNGQPALFSVGEVRNYISRVSADYISDTSVFNYRVETDSILSGISFSVVPQIMDDEIILQITPIATALLEMQKVKFGGDTGVEMQLPRSQIRQMTSVVNVKNGEMLIIGGLIDSRKASKNSGIPYLENIPFLGHIIFGNESDSITRRELVILLRPTII